MGKASALAQKHKRSKNACLGDKAVKDIRWSGSRQGYTSEGLMCHAQEFRLHVASAVSHHTINSDMAWDTGYGIL